MTQKVIATLAVVVVAYLASTSVFAAIRELECRDWVDKRYRGLYVFSFDTDSKVFSGKFKPNPNWPLAGQQIESWKVRYEKDLHVVVGGSDPDSSGTPFVVFSLDFGNVRMFAYGMGTDREASAVVSTVVRECKRTD